MYIKFDPITKFSQSLYCQIIYVYIIHKAVNAKLATCVQYAHYTRTETKSMNQ